VSRGLACPSPCPSDHLHNEFQEPPLRPLLWDWMRGIPAPRLNNWLGCQMGPIPCNFLVAVFLQLGATVPNNFFPANDVKVNWMQVDWMSVSGKIQHFRHFGCSQFWIFCDRSVSRHCPFHLFSSKSGKLMSFCVGPTNGLTLMISGRFHCFQQWH